MIRVRCLVVIVQVATHTGVRCGIVIPVVTGGAITGNGGMSACKDIIIVVDRESCRFPVGICSMTGFTGIRDIYGCMVRICRLVIRAGVAF